MKRVLAMCLLTGSLPLAGQAEVGDKTEALLELQRSETAASRTPRPMSGEQAENIHKRYLDSFTHPIPDFYFEPNEGFTDTE